MAVNISSFSAWITIEGNHCPFYNLKHSRDGREAACWIPSQDEKKFSVNWSNSFRDRPVFAQLLIDGVVCSTHFMLGFFDYPDDPSCIGISYATTSDFTRRDFVFSKIVVTDDDAYLHTLDSPPAFGTIRLELWEADIASIRRAPYQHAYGSQVLESQVIHETSKKAGAHHVKFGGEYIVPQPTVNIVSGTKRGLAPLATFVFQYRPAAILMAAGIIPRPPAAAASRVKAEQFESVDERILDLEAQLHALRAQQGGVPQQSYSQAHRQRQQQQLQTPTEWRVDPRTGRTLQVIDLSDL